MKIIISLFIPWWLYAEWIMFADSQDTYLYNNQSGEVYIRYRQGGENYKDIFVRMPNGVIPNNGNINTPKTSTPLPQNKNVPALNSQQDAAKKLAEDALKQVGNMLYEGN